MLFENRNLLCDNQLKLNINRGKLHMGEEKYTMETNCPKAEDTLTWMDVKWKEVTHEYTEKITAGSEIKIELSLFQGFMAEIDMIDDVNTLYYAMRIVHPFAKHIMAVFRLPGKNFVKFQKGCDDSEYGTA